MSPTCQVYTPKEGYKAEQKTPADRRSVHLGCSSLL